MRELLPLSLVKALLGLLIIFLTQSVFATGYPILADGVLEISVAKTAPTRISIEGDKITDIFVHPAEAVEAVIHSSGCLMILPQNGHEKVHITVFSENDVSQDLQLRFTEKTARLARLEKISLERMLGEP